MYEEQVHPIEAAHGLEAASPIPTGQPTLPLAEDGGLRLAHSHRTGGAQMLRRVRFRPRS